jgi:hypothetical protein
MSTDFIHSGIWATLTKAARASSQRCYVAVAYFGKGACKMLPLKEGSRLVVDASDLAVKSGQTCPQDLIDLQAIGVEIYSVRNLHAKVFVLGRAAFIGSANASNRSKNQLVEAVIRTTDRLVIEASRQFVNDLRGQELTPEVLKRLNKIYRPPLIPGGNRIPVGFSDKPALSNTFIESLDQRKSLSEADQAILDSGWIVAKSRRTGKKRDYEVEDITFAGGTAIVRGDVLFPRVTARGRRDMIEAPSNVLHVKHHRDSKNRKIAFVYVERRICRRRTVQQVAKSLGHGALKRLRKDGKIRDAVFAQRLRNLWAS